LGTAGLGGADFFLLGISSLSSKRGQEKYTHRWLVRLSEWRRLCIDSVRRGILN